MTTRIAPNSDVSPQAEIAGDVDIGPFCIVSAGVRIGSGTTLDGQVTLDGKEIGVQRIKTELMWSHQAKHLLKAYERFR